MPHAGEQVAAFRRVNKAQWKRVNVPTISNNLGIAWFCAAFSFTVLRLIAMMSAGLGCAYYVPC